MVHSTERERLIQVLERIALALELIAVSGFDRDPDVLPDMHARLIKDGWLLPPDKGP